MDNLMIGLLVTAIPGLVLGYLMLRKQAPIFRMYLAMLLVGLGYLTATGAMEDIGARVTGQPNVVPVVDAPAPAAASPDTPAAAAPAPEQPATDAAATPAPAADAPAAAPAQ